jgi:uncharacterized protein (TIGR02246 family)
VIYKVRLVLRLTSIILLWSALGIVGCASPPAQDDAPSAFGAEAERVHAVLERLIAADNAGDLQSVLSCYDADVTLLPPQGEAIRGRDAVERHYRELFASQRLQLEIGFAETMLSADNATVLGTVKGQRRSLADGSSARIDDLFTAILVRGSDREWRVLQLAWKPGPPHR